MSEMETDDGRLIDILVVEDNPADVELFQLACDAAGLRCKLTIIDDGAEALAFFRQEGKYAGRPAPDLAILDLNLPKHDGLELLQAARANREFAELPIVVLSSSSSIRERSQLKAFEKVRCITKPIDLDRYLAIGETIRTCLAEGVEHV
jgi:CheY-like chemotaxis protein